MHWGNGKIATIRMETIRRKTDYRGVMGREGTITTSGRNHHASSLLIAIPSGRVSREAIIISSSIFVIIQYFLSLSLSLLRPLRIDTVRLPPPSTDTAVDVTIHLWKMPGEKTRERRGGSSIASATRTSASFPPSPFLLPLGILLGCLPPPRFGKTFEF